MAKISGKILDVNNEPLMGANITLRSGSKSGKVGAISDFDGKFTLESNDFSDSDLFEVSYVGFIKQQFSASQLQNKTITLKESLTELSDVVITGTKPKQTTTKPKSKFATHIEKNKYAYAGIGGLLGFALLFLSIKKLK
jgi:hypothetical protein